MLIRIVYKVLHWTIIGVSVEIRFCDDCGKRITDAELAAGGERQLCGTCLANARALEAPVTAPVSSVRNTAVLSKRSTAQIRPARPTERVGSGLTPATRTPFISPAVAVAIAAGVMLGVFGFFAISGSKDEKIAAKADAPTVRPPVVAAPVVVSTPAPATHERPKGAQGEAPAATTPLPSVMRSNDSQPAAPAVHELSPKEEYELRVKRGEIKPAAPAANPDAPKEIPASTDEWKEIFNGKDLTGFHTVNGNWKVEDGALTSVASGDRSRIQTDAQYGDFELKFKFMMVVGRYAELQLREYSQVYPLNVGSGVWREVTVKAFGLTTTATMDGVQLSMVTDCSNSAANGVLGFYTQKGGSIKLKEISLRPIRKP